MNPVTIEARQLAFAYDDKPVLRDINFSIAAGELFTILGPSGSGKSTLLRLLAGLDRPSTGSLLLNGVPIGDTLPAIRTVGMVFQHFALWPHMDVFANVAFALDEARMAATEIRQRVEAILKLLEIEHKRDARPDQLSIGQQQRVALARALVIEPSVLLLDDPFSNLEPELRLQMRQDLRRLQRRLGITTILVTHDQDDALSISDRVAMLADGLIQQVGTPAAIYDFPATVTVARFVGVTNFLPGHLHRLDEFSLRFDSPHIGSHAWTSPRPVREEGQSLLCIRPHALKIQPVDSFRDGRYIWLEGHIHSSEFQGESLRYHVEVGGILLCIKQAHFTGCPAIPVGTPVLAGFDPCQARIYPHPGGDFPAIGFAASSIG